MAGKSYFFFLAAILGVVALFIISSSNANAYAIGSTTGTSTGLNANYDFGGSFQNLILPFKSFFNSLQLNTSATINIHPTSVTVPPINITPSVQNIFNRFDDWFYGATHIQLSGLFNGIVNVIIWIVAVAKGIANWLWELIK